MSISLKTRKKLWAKSSNRCAFPSCRQELVVEETETDDASIIADEVHIVGKEINGPRGNSTLTSDERDKYDNLMLLCKIHHKQIDDQENTYTVSVLKDMKNNHIEWVNKTFNPDINKQKDEEIFAEYIDTIEQLANFNDWVDWTYCLLGASFPKIKSLQFDNLILLHTYISERVYPKSNKNLVNALTIFNVVLEDFINEFELYKQLDNIDKDWYKTEQLYKLGAVSVEKQNLHEYMLEELIIELTKSGNYLCDQIRISIFPAYRLKQGMLLLRDAPIMGNAYLRLEYKNNQTYCGFSEIRDRTKRRLKQK